MAPKDGSRYLTSLAATAVLLFLLGCTRPAGKATAVGSADVASPDDGGVASGTQGTDGAAVSAEQDPDGDDDPIDSGAGPLPTDLRFERVGRAPLALRRICDLTPLGDALYASHANEPLGTDGATVTRYRPDDAKHPFSVAAD